MKNIPRTIKVSGAIILSILLIQACVQPIKPTDSGRPVVVELVNAKVKEPDKFCDHIRDNASADATYGFVVVQPGKDPILCCKPGDCSASTLTVKVDKVTKSATVDASAGHSPRWGSHVTQRLSSLRSSDLAVVGGELKPQP